MDILFYIAAAVAVVSSTMVILVTSVIHSLLYLIVSLLAVSIVFFTLGAPFAAALEIITYAGAIMVLFLFAVMMLNRGTSMEKTERESLTMKAMSIPGMLVFVLLVSFGIMVYRAGVFSGSPAGAGPKEIGMALFGPYLLGVELASVLLLAGLVGAFHIGRRMGK
jgi:NADH-quinone oxidoreductase subunit J